MNYREVFLDTNLVVTANASGTAEDTLEGSFGQGTAKVIINVSAVTGTSPTVTPQVRAILTLPDGTTRDVLLYTFAAITAVGSYTQDITNCPKRIYIKYTAVGGTTPHFTIDSVVVRG